MPTQPTDAPPETHAITAEDLAELWPLRGDSLGRWRDQLRRWRTNPDPQLRLWRDYHCRAEATPGRSPFVYRYKRIVYLLLTEHTSITAELRQERLTDLRAAHNRLLSSPPDTTPQNSDNSYNSENS